MASSAVHEFSDANFSSEVLSSSLPVLVDFWAPWCGPCRMIAPVIDELATEFAGKIKVGKVNVDENAKVASTYRIQAIPALFIFKNGEVVDKIVGVVGKAAIVSKLNAVL